MAGRDELEDGGAREPERGTGADLPATGSAGGGSAGAGPAVTGRVSRRAMMGGAGVAVAAAALGTVAAGHAGAADRPAAGPPRGRSGAALTVAEFVARIDQTGTEFVAYGFLTRAAGLDPSVLFDGSDATVDAALVTARATGTLVGRAVDGAVHSLDIEGELSLYQRDAVGASFDDPDGFADGRRIARYDLVLQDVLTVIATDTGLPTLLGDMRQTDADTVAGGDGPFGRPGLQLRFFATGLGHRSEATAPAASLSVAGSFSHA